MSQDEVSIEMKDFQNIQENVWQNQQSEKSRISMTNLGVEGQIFKIESSEVSVGLN